MNNLGQMVYVVCVLNIYEIFFLSLGSSMGVMRVCTFVFFFFGQPYLWDRMGNNINMKKVN